jgi:hypothetical protein
MHHPQALSNLTLTVPKLTSASQLVSLQLFRITILWH